MPEVVMKPQKASDRKPQPLSDTPKKVEGSEVVRKKKKKLTQSTTPVSTDKRLDKASKKLSTLRSQSIELEAEADSLDLDSHGGPEAVFKKEYVKMLNLQEMYGVAKNFRPGTKEYREVYEIAATNYPTDIVANINAASANIVYGDFDRAQQYIERVKDDPRAWNNLGVLAWLSGDSEIAKEWFTKALTIEPEKAQENLNKIK
jgi:tetratricopeptide (TPR) repeat protein